MITLIEVVFSELTLNYGLIGKILNMKMALKDDLFFSFHEKITVNQPEPAMVEQLLIHQVVEVDELEAAEALGVLVAWTRQGVGQLGRKPSLNFHKC